MVLGALRIVIVISILPSLLIAQSVRAIQADTIPASVGINTHLQYRSYGHYETLGQNSVRTDAVISALSDLGIRKIRDRLGFPKDIHEARADLRYAQKLKRLSEIGIEASLFALPTDPFINPAEAIDEVKMADLLINGGIAHSINFPGGIRMHAFLGPNERDHIFSRASHCPGTNIQIPEHLTLWVQKVTFCRGETWAADLVNFVANIHDGIRNHSSPTIRSLKISGPTLVNAVDYPTYGLFGFMSTLSEFVDTMPVNLYTWRRPLGQGTPTGFQREFPVREAMFQNSQSRPLKMDITETGYYTVPLNQNDNNWATEGRQARHILMSILDAFRYNRANNPNQTNVNEVYIYVLADPTDEVVPLDPMNSSFGIIRGPDHGFERKPAFGALKNFLDIFNDRGEEFVTGSLNFTVSSLTSLKYDLYQKRNGTFLLALWNEPNGPYNLDNDRTVPVTINFQKEFDINVYRPTLKRTPIFKVTTDVFQMNVPDDVIILEIKNESPQDSPQNTPTPPPPSSPGETPPTQEPIITPGKECKLYAEYSIKQGALRVRIKVKGNEQQPVKVKLRMAGVKRNLTVFRNEIVSFPLKNNRRNLRGETKISITSRCGNKNVEVRNLK